MATSMMTMMPTAAGRTSSPMSMAQPPRNSMKATSIGPGGGAGHHRGVFRLPVTLLPPCPAVAGSAVQGIRWTRAPDLQGLPAALARAGHARARGRPLRGRAGPLLGLSRRAVRAAAALRARRPGRVRHQPEPRPRALRALPRRPQDARRGGGRPRSGTRPWRAQHAKLPHQRQAAGGRPARRGLPRRHRQRAAGGPLMAFMRVVRGAGIPAGRGCLVEAGPLTLAVFNGGSGRFYAVSALCPHEEGPLADGWIEGDAVVCPWHGFDFDLATA